MNAERWARLDALFQEAIARPAEERAAFIAAASSDDAEVRAELTRLLAAHEAADRFLGSPALAAAWSWTQAQEDETDGLATGRVIGAYRLLHEIGRGGMGVVHLAERADGQYERRVAVKLIRRGMDSDVVLRRFLAERQILASLEHPNIAHLLDGGTTDDGRPYFVMEYVQGEPIDVYARSRALTIPERLQLFLQVCDAVSHAHAQRIIHRDIKPANMLVTAEGVPKLLDFGIARVLEPELNAPTLALTGWRLLTPEYASPEQIDGRSATVASDVYSLGVVLYELLAGCSPYGATHDAPLAVAQAVRTTIPKRPSAALLESQGDSPSARGSAERSDAQLRAPGASATRSLARQLRGDLDTIVLTALRKDAERRYPSVELFAADIRRHLAGVPVLARPDTWRYRAGKFVRRNRAAVISTALTFLALTTLAGAAWIATGDARADVSLIAAGQLAPRDRIVVADFFDRAGDSGLASAITDAFRTDFAQSNIVRGLTLPQLRAALVRMQHAPNAVLNDSLARELAVREGAKAVVLGNIAKVGSAYTINVHLVGVERGEALSSVRETARDSTQLIAAVDRASETLRRQIGESLRAVRATPSLEQVTTASLPALRAYTEGYRRFVAGDRTGALPLLEQAVALDTAFAMAYRTIALIYEALAEPGRSHEALQRSMSHLERMPYLERQFLIAGNAYTNGDNQTTIATYHDVLESYPTYVPALNNLALAHRALREFAVAESLWHRAIALDSTISVLYYGLHTVEVLQGRFVESARTLELIGRRFPNDDLLDIVRVQDAAARQDWEEAERQATANLASFQRDSLEAVDAQEALAGIVMTRGRLLEAERLWRRQLVVAEAAGSWSRHLLAAQQLTALELRFRLRPDRARALMDSILAEHPPDEMLPGDRSYDMLARFYAEAGDISRARSFLSAAERLDDGSPGSSAGAERNWTLGVLALAEGRIADAKLALERTADTHDCPICALPDLARAHEADGNMEAALAMYERYVDTPWLWRYTPDARHMGRVLMSRGELYERSGDHTRAREAYAELLRLWAGAEGEALVTAEAIRRRMGPTDAR
jgi:serine/threonine protein kinase/tetratricopeptide (TPR) repeat protein